MNNEKILSTLCVISFKSSIFLKNMVNSSPSVLDSKSALLTFENNLLEISLRSIFPVS